jgi:DNA-binding CsgD family transcriptional regulator
MMTYPLKVLSSVNLKLENIDAAISYADRSLELSKELNSIYEMKDAQMNLYKAYNTLGNYEKALHHYVEYDILNDSLLNENANARLADARSQYETEKKQQEIDILAAENKLQESRIIGISSSLGFALIGLSAFGWVYFSRKKKELELSEKNKIIAQSKKKIAEEELANSRLKTEHLQKELSNFALHIVEKNDFLEELKKEISAIKSQVKNAELLKPINALGSRIYQNQMLNKDREEFEIQVEQASSGFFKKLEEEYPDITSQERRLAALLRLDLSSKEIAGILNIAPKSVDQSRYRLRKKLELDSNRNLNVFLNTI